MTRLRCDVTNFGKTVTNYYCAGCKGRLVRKVRSRKLPYVSFCTTADKPIKLRLLKEQP